MTPSARSNGRGGYKAVIVHAGGRTEVLGTQRSLTQDGRDTFISRAAPSMDRQEAIAYAERVIVAREDYAARYRTAHPHLFA